MIQRIAATGMTNDTSSHPNVTSLSSPLLLHRSIPRTKDETMSFHFRFPPNRYLIHILLTILLVQTIFHLTITPMISVVSSFSHPLSLHPRCRCLRHTPPKSSSHDDMNNIDIENDNEEGWTESTRIAIVADSARRSLLSHCAATTVATIAIPGKYGIASAAVDDNKTSDDPTKVVLRTSSRNLPSFPSSSSSPSSLSSSSSSSLNNKETTIGNMDSQTCPIEDDSSSSIGGRKMIDTSTTLEGRRIDVFEKAAPSVVYIDTFIEQRDTFSPSM